MIYDLKALEADPFTRTYDVCIAGAGVAGITLARKLAASQKTVLLLEAGDREFSRESQDLYEGDNVGFEYFHLDIARLRFLGGTSNHWTGWCRPLDSVDFSERNHIPESKWPIDQEDLLGYMSEALDIFEIEPFKDVVLQDSGGLFNKVEYRISKVRFKDKYLQELESSTKIDLYLNANLTDIRIAKGNGRTDSFTVESYTNSATFSVKANEYILALGGIENARTLLNANSQIPKGIGNQNDLVGRYFMEHLHFDVGYFVANPHNQKFFDTVNFVSPTRKLINSAKIANFGFRIRTGPSSVEVSDQSLIADTKVGVKKVLCTSEILMEFLYKIRGKGINCSTWPRTAGTIRVAYEQVPNHASRVKLSDTIDRFGLQKVELDWRLSGMDKKTIQVASLELAKYFIRSDRGRVKINDWILQEDNSNFPGFTEGEELAGFHHMGTTRMGFSPQDGVVDKNCRVFGVSNLYIAGSSIYRTAGQANPTFTIGLLALRLVDHITSKPQSN